MFEDRHREIQAVERSSLALEMKRATSQTEPTLLVTPGNHSSATPKDWLTFSAGGPIDFRPLGLGNTTIRVTRRPNAATVYESQIYNLNLECFFHIFNITVSSKQPIFPANAIVCNPDILGIVINAVFHPQQNTPVETVMYAFESIQQLSHHLSIQEMDWELYRGPYDALAPLVATGCLAFDDCGHVPGSVPDNVTFGPTTDIYTPPEEPGVKKNFAFITPKAPPISPAQFTDVILWYYRAMVQNVFDSATGQPLLMPFEIPRGYGRPSLHMRQIFTSNYDSRLYLAVAQGWKTQYDFSLLDVAELINFHLRPRVLDGRLTVGTRGKLDKVVKGRPREPKWVGEWCMWYVGHGHSICERLFSNGPRDQVQPPFGASVAATS
ncbi:MAG: hypothetical protein Q9216_002982 [Gyalolechia sp. 2 TL-2023]